MATGTQQVVSDSDLGYLWVTNVEGYKHISSPILIRTKDININIQRTQLDETHSVTVVSVGYQLYRSIDRMTKIAELMEHLQITDGTPSIDDIRDLFITKISGKYTVVSL